MKFFILVLSLYFLQACSQQNVNTQITEGQTEKQFKKQFNELKTLLSQPPQCRQLKDGKVSWPVRQPSNINKSSIHCKQMFNRLKGQTLYFSSSYDEHDPAGGVLLKSNFFKYPEPVDCFDSQNNIIDCPGLDISKMVFGQGSDNSLMVMILYPDQELNTATVRLEDNEKICQITFSINSKTQTYKTETYNILALYSGRQKNNSAPLCNEEALALAPIFQDTEAKNLCKAKIEQSFQEALKRIDPRDHEELKKRANELKKNCDTKTLNRLRVGFFLTPELEEF